MKIKRKFVFSSDDFARLPTELCSVIIRSLDSSEVRVTRKTIENLEADLCRWLKDQLV
jgi:hypothetical protein